MLAAAAGRIRSLFGAGRAPRTKCARAAPAIGAGDTPVERSLRIIIVGPGLVPPGGQAVQADRLRRRLTEVPGWHITFVAINPVLPGLLGACQRVKYLRTLVTSIAYFWTLLRAVPQADVIHAFSASYWSFLLAPVPAMLLGRLFGKPIILNYRSGEGDDHLTRWRSAHWGVRLADRIVTPSGYLVDVFARHGYHGQVIANFVDTDRFAFRERIVLRPRFLANRAFEPLYNVPCVVRAFARVQARYPHAALVLAGDGSERGAIEQLIRELGLRNVTFTGRVDPEEMPALCDAADIYLNASNIDNMPGSIIECFSAGLSVISTSAGGIPYIVTNGETGLLVPVDDHRALGDAALRLLEEPGLARRLAAAARSEVERRYAWTAVRDSWLTLYRELAAA